MEKEKLVVEIIDICYEFKIIKSLDNISQKQENLKAILEDAGFVEILYSEIFRKAKERQIIHTEKIKQVLLALEKIRLDLECESESNGVKDKEFKVH